MHGNLDRYIDDYVHVFYPVKAKTPKRIVQMFQSYL